MNNTVRGGKTLLGRMKSSPLFSIWRLAGVLFVAFTAPLLDMLYLHIIGIETIYEVASQTIINTVGLYAGFTLATLFGPSL
jgi:hypothetical protein